MAVLWEDAMRISWESSWSITGREWHENTIGNTVATLWEDWEYSGKTVRIAWEYCGNTGGTHWEYYGNIMGKLLELRGNPMGMLWED